MINSHVCMAVLMPAPQQSALTCMPPGVLLSLLDCCRGSSDLALPSTTQSGAQDSKYQMPNSRDHGLPYLLLLCCICMNGSEGSSSPGLMVGAADRWHAAQRVHAVFCIAKRSELVAFMPFHPTCCSAQRSPCHALRQAVHYPKHGSTADACGCQCTSQPAGDLCPLRCGA